MPLSLNALTQKMADFSPVPFEETEPNRSPKSVGVGSLVAVELRIWLGPWPRIEHRGDSEGS